MIAAVGLALASAVFFITTGEPGWLAAVTGWLSAALTSWRWRRHAG